MKKIVVLGCLLFSFNLSSQTTDWVIACGGDYSDKGISIGTDSLGFIYISGFFNGQADFGPHTVYASYNNNKNIFVAKMDSLGNFLWAVAGTGGPYDDRALGMHVDKAGNTYITGTFWGYVEFPSATGPISVGGNGCDTSYLIKIDSDGNCVFAIQICNGTGSGSCPWPIYDCDDHSYDVKVDDDGFIYVTGFYSTYSADFGPFTLDNPNWADCQPAGYIGKWDAAGNIIWVEGFDGIKDQRGSRDNRIALDQFSNIYCVGGFQNTGIFGPFSLTSNGEWDAFIFKMDTDGNWLWAKNIGSNKTDRANSIAVDVCGDVYITGEYRNPMVFPGANASNGTDTLSHKQKRDVFVAKMNNQGQWKWAKRARSSKTDKPYQMSVDINKQVFVCGTSGSEMTYSNGLVVNAQIPGDTTMSAWVAQIDGTSNNGDWVWAKMGGCDTDDDDRTNDICPDGFGNVYAIGFFEDLANFDGTILDATGRRKDIFVWKMSMTPMPPFTYNNTYDTIFTDSMMFNTVDTGLFTTSGYVIDGCDTIFTDSVVHQKLGVRINYNINNPGTATFTIDGTVQAMPFSQNYWSGEAINIQAGIQPNWLFSQWKSYNNTVLPNINSTTASFVATLSDSCVLYTYPKPPLQAFISGNDTICSNGDVLAQVLVSFSAAVEPYTFVYAINGINQPSITTTVNPYVINTNEGGTYTLSSFADASEVGWVSGSGIITVQQAPTALFTTAADTLTILHPSLQLNDVSIGNISSWNWSFGDNTTNDFNQHPYHSYKDSLGIYQISLIVTDNLGCSDTTSKQLWIADEYWMYIPNSFTPDHDGVNDLFCLVHHGIRANTFHFNLFDRFSNLVYATEKIAELECFLNANGWDGTHFKTGNDLPMGTYIYEVYYQDFQGWKHQDMGHLFIVR